MNVELRDPDVDLEEEDRPVSPHTSLDSHEGGLRPTKYKDLIQMQHYMELRDNMQSDWNRIEIDESGCAVTKKLEYGTYLVECNRVVEP